ncbi:MAG: rhomboid family intramembrane serine protease, partial [Candidatus Brocadiia bacterium]
MLPLRDKNPPGTTPVVLYALIVANVAAFLFEFSLPDEQLRAALTRFGVVPSQVVAALRGEAPLLAALLLPAFTSMFLHGGWVHLLGNMWFLHIFGDNVEGRLGHGGFLVFYLVCGLMATAAQVALSAGSDIPTIGASGAIAGVLGAYAVCWPRARVLTLVPIFYLIH